MSLVEHKQQLFLELKERYSREGSEVMIADSILIRHGNSITKIPMQRCVEEVFIINTFRHLGLPTVEITDSSLIETHAGKIPSYTMKVIDGVVEPIQYGSRFLNNNYYEFLSKIFKDLESVKMDGFGAIQLTNSNVRTEFDSDRELLGNVLERVEKRQYWPKSEIDKLKSQLAETDSESEAILVHSDILHNILKDATGKYYLIDPQTIVSAANKYWDLSNYLINANGYGCTSGLMKFIKHFDIENWNLFLLTAKINAYERTSFYTHYDPSRVPGMVAFLESLKEEKIRVGDQILTRKDL